MNNLEKAKRILSGGEYTCVLANEKITLSTKERGVKPLVKWLESSLDFHDFSAADKVIGKGAAFLYLLLGIKSIYAFVISTPALELLRERNVYVEYSQEVDNIINRQGTGICPFEEAVLPITDEKLAYQLIKEKMQSLGIK
ncbi:MAG: DUF1893 domain-containing protein [Clostridia bacterium]|nr:DUF1893 domain-containing protein [Clostridia bacterium]